MIQIVHTQTILPDQVHRLLSFQDDAVSCCPRESPHGPGLQNTLRRSAILTAREYTAKARSP
jgi:hypothetical protein